MRAMGCGVTGRTAPRNRPQAGSYLPNRGPSWTPTADGAITRGTTEPRPEQCWRTPAPTPRRADIPNPITSMTLLSLASLALPVAAAGWSLLYLLAGGGLFGAIVIFIIAKIFRR